MIGTLVTFIWKEKIDWKLTWGGELKGFAIQISKAWDSQFVTLTPPRQVPLLPPLIHFSSFRPSPTLSNTQSHIASPKLFLPSSHGEINNNLIFLTCGGCQIARGMVEQAQGEGQRPARHPAPAKLRPCRSCRRCVLDDNVRRLWVPPADGGGGKVAGCVLPAGGKADDRSRHGVTERRKFCRSGGQQSLKKVVNIIHHTQ